MSHTSQTDEIIELDKVIADGDQAVVAAVVTRICAALECAAGTPGLAIRYTDGLRAAARVARRVIPTRSRPQPSSAAAAVDNVRALLPFLDDDVATRVAAALYGAEAAADEERAREAIRDHDSPNRWADLFPQGRVIFYEGDAPDQFAAVVRCEFGFDPSTDSRWGERIDMNDGSHTSYGFQCPPGLLDGIYGDGRFPMGS